MGKSGARCAYTLSKKTRSLPKEVWDKERVGQVCTSRKSFAENQANLMKLCSGYRRCAFEEIEPPTEEMKK